MSYRENSKPDLKSEVSDLHNQYEKEQEDLFQQKLNSLENEIKISAREGKKYHYIEMSSDDIGDFLFWAWAKSQFAKRMEQKLIELGFEPKAYYSDMDIFGTSRGFRIRLI